MGASSDFDVDAVVRDVVAGARDRYREIVARFEVSIRVLLAAMLADAATVEDLAHEVFITAFMKLGDYRPGTDFRAWLKAIARNVALSERRRWARQQKMERNYRRALDDLMERALADVADQLGPEVLDSLRGCVDGLAEPARAVVVAYYFEDRDVADIAARAGRTASWVKIVLFRARAALAQCLGRRENVW